MVTVIKCSNFDSSCCFSFTVAMHVCTYNLKKLRDELTRALLEAKNSDVDEEGAESFNDLVKEMTASKRHDLEAFAFKTKAMVHIRNYSFTAI